MQFQKLLLLLSSLTELLRKQHVTDKSTKEFWLHNMETCCLILYELFSLKTFQLQPTDMAHNFVLIDFSAGHFVVNVYYVTWSCDANCINYSICLDKLETFYFCLCSKQMC